MKITYLEKGIPFDFKRMDKIKTINLERTWKSGNLLYGYVDRYNVKAICTEDIIKKELANKPENLDNLGGNGNIKLWQ